MIHNEDAETFSAEFKAKVALEAIKGHETVGLHPVPKTPS